MNLLMNIRDIELWENDELKGFVLPFEDYLPEVGEVVNILEPFKKLTVTETVEKNGEQIEKKVAVGVVYRSDNELAFDKSRPTYKEYDEAPGWSSASQLPEYAIRRQAKIVKVETVSLQSITKEQIELLKLDYASQGDPQLLLEDYLPVKNFELFFKWWKQHYRTSLKENDDPKVIILHLVPTD